MSQLTSKRDFLSTLTPPQCPICYEHVNAPVSFSCEHTFCLECAKTWLKTAATCPSCRTILYDDELDDDVSEDDSDAEMLPDPEYVEEAFASSVVVEPAEPTTISEGSGFDSVTLPRQGVLSRLPRLHRPVAHREAALERRRLAIRQWQTSLYKLFRTLQKIHRNLEIRKRAYDRQRTSLLEAAIWLRTQIELQDQYHAEVMRQAEEERADRRSERETVAEQGVQGSENENTGDLGRILSVENTGRKGGKWSWERVKKGLRGKRLGSQVAACDDGA